MQEVDGINLDAVIVNENPLSPFCPTFLLTLSILFPILAIEQREFTSVPPGPVPIVHCRRWVVFRGDGLGFGQGG
jgi:hypothetical protein